MKDELVDDSPQIRSDSSSDHSYINDECRPRAFSQDSHQSSEWTDTDDIQDKKKSELDSMNETELTEPVFLEHIAERSKRPSKFRTLKDYKRYDRPDMFVNKLFPYMGMHLAPNTEKTQTILPAFSLTNPRSKVIRIIAENGVSATGAELFSCFQKSVLDVNNGTSLPKQMSIKDQKLELNYTRPHGDEFLFGTHSQDIQWIGEKCLGTIHIAPVHKYQDSDYPLANMHDWQKEHSFRTWHQSTPIPDRSSMNRKQKKKLNTVSSKMKKESVQIKKEMA